MKTVWMLCLLLMPLLAGCGGEETLETVADVWPASGLAEPRSVAVELPKDAAVPVLESETRQMYMGENYELMLEIVPSGDLSATVRMLSGYAPEALTVMQTKQAEANRYEFVWAAAGEPENRLGRAVILDDGAYHYCLSAVRDAQTGAEQTDWEAVFSSFCLSERFIHID